uniref:Uncharacterized protein n=1 Tax=Podoviridae sp. ct8Lf7 TaxID=2827723 RepID=A0A8S5S1D2_9CAUD|nr:MAG TPA: hypothetical protein [Podoviridae sp. ct8Lf7]
MSISGIFFFLLPSKLIVLSLYLIASFLSSNSSFLSFCFCLQLRCSL